MAFINEQKIGKNIYVYKAENYWDKEKKQSRQRRVYLGKKDPKTGEIIHTQKTKEIVGLQDYGVVHFLNEIADRLELKACLKEIYPNLWKQILTCAFFEISESKPLYLCKSWVELNNHDILCSDLSSQRISELLKAIGGAQKLKNDFFNLWGQAHAETDCVFYDITSLSSYSKKIRLIEWGYNRDKENLPQINIGVVYGEPFSLPLFYRIHQGSIPDVSTLRNTLKLTKYIGLKNIAFIMDKGFYSKLNLKDMIKEDMRFIIPYPERNKTYKELIEKHSKNILSPKNVFSINKDILYGLKDRVGIEGKAINAFIYLDEKKKIDTNKRFYKKIIDIEERVKETGFETKEDVEEYLHDNLKDWHVYLKIIKKQNKYVITRKIKEIIKAIDKMGKVILLSNYGISIQDAMLFYRRKDAIEKYFDKMKNDLDSRRLRVHSEESLEGRLFLIFISLIIYSYICKVMRETSLNKKYTIQEIIYELKKIKRIQLRNEMFMITEISKKQRELFKYFKIKIPQT